MILTVRNYENRGKAYYPPHKSIYEYTVKCQQGLTLAMTYGLVTLFENGKKFIALTECFH